jgi:hypothetical protein
MTATWNREWRRGKSRLETVWSCPEKAPDLTAVERRLQSSGLFRAGQVRYSFEEGVLVLSGTVSSYYEKQQLQEFVMKLTGVARLKNCVEVK